jgi:hypothetical protein
MGFYSRALRPGLPCGQEPATHSLSTQGLICVHSARGMDGARAFHSRQHIFFNLGTSYCSDYSATNPCTFAGLSWFKNIHHGIGNSRWPKPRRKLGHGYVREKPPLIKTATRAHSPSARSIVFCVIWICISSSSSSIKTSARI